jgi:AraC family transcriptional regulator
VISDSRLDRILDLVEESLDAHGLCGEDLARRAYLSRYHFDRLVRAALGEAPGGFRRRLLLERAAHALTGSDESVIEIAFTAGFRSSEAFTRAFKRAYGETPTGYRAGGRQLHSLPAPSGIHFHPPGGLRLSADSRSTSMDLLASMYDHHVRLTGEIVERSDRLTDDVLDRPIELSVEGIDEAPTLRRLDDKLVRQLEMWITAVEGGTAMPAPGPTDPAGLRARLDAAAPEFRRLVVEPVLDGRGGETFIDAVCDPPETFSYAGVLAHVLTFSAVRRTMAIGALEKAGIDDLGAGDPMHAVGGTGSDASTITRTPADLRS